MDANRLQLAAALQARDGQQGGQMAQKGYGQRPGIPTRTGMPQQTGVSGFEGPMPSQAMPAMRGPMGADPQFGAPSPAGKPMMNAGRPMPRPMG